MNITEVRLSLTEPSPSLAKLAFVFDGTLLVRGIQLIEERDGPLLKMPGSVHEGTHYEIVSPSDEATRSYLLQTAVDAYEKARCQKRWESPNPDAGSIPTSDIEIQLLTGAKLRASVAMTVEDSLVLRKIRVIQGRDLLVSWPFIKTEYGSFLDVCCFLGRESRVHREKEVIAAYLRAVESTKTSSNST